MTGLRLVSIVAAFSIAVAVALPQGLGKKSRDDSGKERQNSSQRSEQRSRGNSQERSQPQRQESRRSDPRDYQPRQQSQRQDWQPRQQPREEYQPRFQQREPQPRPQIQREEWQPRKREEIQQRQEIQKREETNQPRDQRDWQPRQPAREEWIPNSDNAPRQRKEVPGWEGNGNFNREPQGKPERGGQGGLGKKGGNQGGNQSGSGKSQEPEKKPERGGPPERGGGERGQGGFPQRGGGSGNDPRDDRPPIGRVERPQWQGSQGQGQLERRRESNLKYGTINNLATRGDTGPIRIGRAPVKALRSLPNQVLREERVRTVSRGFRTGYFAYTRNWCDDDFLFRWYAFDCYPATRVYCSPWYYYPHLPAYLTPGCVSVLSINLGPVNWYTYDYRRSGYYQPYGFGGGYYNGSGYTNGGGYDRRYNDRTDIDYAVDDLVRAFERSDRRSIENLIPTYGDVHIWVDGEYSYSMQADRFYDLMMDNVTSTRTRSYEIVRVRTYRDEAEVLARHEFVNPWGEVDCVYHWFRLERERGGFVIRHFGTSNYRAW